MNAQDYINRHPKSYLAKALVKAGIAGNTEIILGSGLITDNPNSNLQNALRTFGSSQYVVGGRAGQRANDGNHFAIIIK